MNQQPGPVIVDIAGTSLTLVDDSPGNVDERPFLRCGRKRNRFDRQIGGFRKRDRNNGERRVVLVVDEFVWSARSDINVVVAFNTL